MNEQTKNAIDVAGGPKALADLLAKEGVCLTRQAIEQWASVPPKHVLMVEKVTGISRYQLRPDVYGSQPQVQKKESNEGSFAA